MSFVNMSESKSGKKRKAERIYCVNPYNDHKKRDDNLKTNFTDDYIQKAARLKIFLDNNSHLCATCYSKINQSKTPVITVPSQAEASSSKTTSTKSTRKTRSAATAPVEHKSENIDSSGSEASSRDSDPTYDEYIKEDLPRIVKKLNNVFKGTGVTLIDQSKMRSKKYSQDKLYEIIEFLSTHVFKVSNPANDSDEMISQLKEKFESVPSRSEKIQILSILPKSWKASKIQEEFGVPKYMAEQVKAIVAKHDTILCGPEKKLGSKKLDDATILAVTKFYLEEISRECPGMRECVIVSGENGQKEKKPRLLVLMNLKEAYIEFQNKYPQHKIGFSKFAELRPKQCVLALEKYGTHTTCVCEYHQNFKLMLTGLQRVDMFKDVESFRQLLELTMCRPITDKCQIGDCGNCIRIRDEFLQNMQKDFDDQMLEAFSFKQWSKIPGKFIFPHLIRWIFFN